MQKVPLTRAELASAYGVTTRTLYTWLKSLGICSLYGRLSIPDCEIIFSKYGKPADIWEEKDEKRKRSQ